MIITVTANPLIDRTLIVSDFQPGRIHRAEQTRETVGGKGINVARILKTMGASVTAVTFAGGGYGDRMVELLRQEDIPTRITRTSSPTRFQVSIQSRGQSLPTDVIDPGSFIETTEKEALISEVEEILRHASDNIEWLILSGSAASGPMDDLYRRLAEIASKYEISVFLDSYGTIFVEGLKANPLAVKPNLDEAEKLSGLTLDSQKKQIYFLKELHHNGVKIPILTLGEKGALLLFEDSVYWGIPPKINTVNPIGSGDAFVGAFTATRSKGCEWTDCFRWGVAAGTANATVWDACGCSLESIESFYLQTIIQKL